MCNGADDGVSWGDSGPWPSMVKPMDSTTPCRHCKEQTSRYDYCGDCDLFRDSLENKSLLTIQSIAAELPVDRLRALRRLFLLAELDRRPKI